MGAEETIIATAAPPPGATVAAGPGHRTSMSEAAPEEQILVGLPLSPRPTPSRIGRGTDRESAAMAVWAAVVGIGEIEVATPVRVAAVGQSSAPTLSQWQAGQLA